VRPLLLLVGAIVLVDTMFFAALTPLLPHYAHTLHLSKAGAGLLAAMYPIGALVAAIPGGVVAARFGVKPTVLAGLSLLAITTTGFGLAHSVWGSTSRGSCRESRVRSPGPARSRGSSRLHRRDGAAS